MMNNEWINHDGGKCPIADDVMIEVEIANGAKGFALSGNLMWGKSFSGDTIIKYRLAIDTNINHVTTTNLSEELASMSINKYNKPCKGITIDVYDVLKAFDVTCPAMQHAIKKCLMAGNRGAKDATQDMNEAIQSIERSKELLG